MTAIESKQDHDRLNDLVNEFLPEFIPIVNKIEKSIKVTQDHYGQYMNIIGMYNTHNERKFIALVLLRAGGNVNGIRSAMRIIG